MTETDGSTEQVDSTPSIEPAQPDNRSDLEDRIRRLEEKDRDKGSQEEDKEESETPEPVVIVPPTSGLNPPEKETEKQEALAEEPKKTVKKGYSLSRWNKHGKR